MDFGARDPVGRVSMAIFMTHARMTFIESGMDVSESMEKFLRWCGGLPIALSVAGCAVAYRMKTVGRFERACAFHVKDFEERRTVLGVERDVRGTSLSEGIFCEPEVLGN